MRFVSESFTAFTLGGLAIIGDRLRESLYLVPRVLRDRVSPDSQSPHLSTTHFLAAATFDDAPEKQGGMISRRNAFITPKGWST
jgi:hypothetical protein